MKVSVTRKAWAAIYNDKVIAVADTLKELREMKTGGEPKKVSVSGDLHIDLEGQYRIAQNKDVVNETYDCNGVVIAISPFK